MTEYEPKPINTPGISFIKHVSWEEVKKSWKDDEDSTNFRREYVEQGHETWESWRSIIINPLNLDELDWSKYTVEQPLITVPFFRGGPFRPWEEMYYGGTKTPTFEDIVKVEGTDVTTRDKFSEIISSEIPIQLIGIRLKGDIYVIEGMHRATSIALAASRHQKIHTPVSLMLADSDLSELQTID